MKTSAVVAFMSQFVPGLGCFNGSDEDCFTYAAISDR